MLKKQCKNINNLAKDAQSNGDPVLSQNYLQHADHYLRRYNELNEKRENLMKKQLRKKNHYLKKNLQKKKVTQKLIKTNHLNLLILNLF